MANSIIPYRIHYLNVQPSAALTAAIEEGTLQLAPYRDRVASCDVHVGSWVQHHDLGRSYRVTLEVEPRAGGMPVSIDCESEQDPPYAALLEQVGQAFQRAARRLSARAEHAASMRVPTLSADARRLHPLHGLAPEERQLGLDDD
ncbi:MAG TPA: hypothetical protein VI299_24565 [Polyangiales bacterium]